MDHELQCVLSNPSVDAIVKFENRMAGGTSPWTVGMAETLLSAIHNSKNTSNLMYLLAKADMDDHVIYAVQQHLPHLMEQASSFEENVSPLSIVAVVRVWEALERLRSFSSPQTVDTLWMYSHVEPRKLNEMAHVAVRTITSPGIMTPTSDGLPTIDPDTVCNAGVSFLSLLLQHDIKEWLLDLDSVTQLTDRLEPVMNRLCDSLLSSPASVGLALSCVGLLCLLRWKIGQDQPSYTMLLTNVCKVAFHSHSNSPSGPQWTYGPVATDVRPCALNLLQIWSLTGEEAIPDHCFTNFVQDSWNAVLETRGATHLPSLLFLHTTRRLPARQALRYVLARRDLTESCRTLVASLMNHCQQKDIGLAASSAALLLTLLKDRRNTITHDDLSRTLWSSLDAFPIDKLIDGVIKLATSDSTSKRACQPLIVSMLDVLELLASFPEGNRKCLLEKFTEQIESMIEIMSARSDSINDLSLSMEEMNQHTPPVNNLSRLDESHISFVEQTPLEEEAEPPTGLDITIRIIVATILVHMSDGGLQSAESTVVWRTRIRTSVLDFVGSRRLHRNPQASADTKLRLFHLQSLLAVSSTENEMMIVSSLVDEDLLCRQERDDYSQQLLHCQQQLEEAQKQVKRLESERDRYRTAMRHQATMLDRDTQRTKSKVTAEVTTLVEIHAAERRAAENRAEACVRRAKHVEEMQKEAENRINEYKELEARAKEELNEIEIKFQTTRQELLQERALTDEQKRQCSSLVEELGNIKNRLQMVEGEHSSTRSRLSENQAALNETKVAYTKLHDDLEETFSQLSLLAQAYQTKEDEIARIVEKKDRAIQEARRSADSESRRNDELEANQRHLQFENDRLVKKLQRAKEKLENERNQRYEESQQRKQRGPVSYINQLHSSTTSDTSRARRTSDKDTSSRHERKRGSNKENGHTSSSSLRRDYR